MDDKNILEKAQAIYSQAVRYPAWEKEQQHVKAHYLSLAATELSNEEGVFTSRRKPAPVVFEKEVQADESDKPDGDDDEVFTSYLKLATAPPTQKKGGCKK